MPRVFFITGTSTGFGSHLLELLKFNNTNDKEGRSQVVDESPTNKSQNFLGVKLDVTKKDEIDTAFQFAIQKFNRVDVIVNNAGYGLSGPFEELSEKQIRTQMGINFFGLIDVTLKVMETMREQRPSGGLIQQVASFTESISHEVKPEWGIKFTCIEPSGFRTDWAGQSMDFPEKRLPAYDHLNAKEMMGKCHGSQAGDPVKGAKTMYELAAMKDPPLRVVIGTDAYQAINGKIKAYGENYKKYEKISNCTDVDGYQALI
ncbi:hypothetical protein G7Y89_g13765 [Cudoniella acicularis]|uniref:NAD(P)-binding protein n=1 Tax=Cudoniella acicularis TaxID=354080 RepID=A0A8H4R6U6_9HELO|nr:hypothetical protein G7Y89_g13765 [Cudoniella acicularis]